MAVDSSKLLERDIGISKGANITAPQVKMLKITKVKLGDVANNLKDNLVLTKVRNAAENKRRQEALRKKREAELENKKKKKKGGGKGIKVPGAGMLGGFINGLITVLWGVVVVKMLDWVKSPAFQNVLKIIGNVGKVILRVVGWLWEGFTTLVDWGYNLYDKGMGWVENNLSPEAVEKIKTFMGNFKNLINGFIAWKLVGEKIVKAVIKNIGRVFNLAKGIISRAYKIARGALKQGARFLNWATRGRAGNLFKNVAGKGKGLLTKAGVGARRFIGRGGRQLLKRGGNILKGGKSIMKRGAGKILKRGALKVFGKGAVKMASKIFGKIPIVGPIIVGIASLLSGEPLGQALFKTFGAAIGGFLGTFIPIPILGTLIGETLGVYVGDLLYTLIKGGGLSAVGARLKKDLMAVFSAGKKALGWIGGGFSRFYEGIPKFKVPDFPEDPPDWIPSFGFGSKKKIWDAAKIGLKVLVGPLSLLMGREIPNLLWMVDPRNTGPLLLKSFFPPGAKDDGAKLSPIKKSDASDVSTSASYEEGGEGTETLIPVNLPEVSKPSATGNNKTKGALPSSSSSDDSNPLLVLYMGK